MNTRLNRRDVPAAGDALAAAPALSRDAGWAELAAQVRADMAGA